VHFQAAEEYERLMKYTVMCVIFLTAPLSRLMIQYWSLFAGG